MYSNYQEILNRQKQRRELIKQTLEKALHVLIDHGSIKIIHFGSSSFDNITSRSDLDLLCIMPDENTGKDWLRILRSRIDYDIDMDLLVYTQNEFDQTFKRSRFLRYIISTGKVIYEK